jgi:hypothetical protein
MAAAALAAAPASMAAAHAQLGQLGHVHPQVPVQLHVSSGGISEESRQSKNKRQRLSILWNVFKAIDKNGDGIIR